MKDINEAILLAWNASENDNAAIPNHIIMPYEQFNYLATTKVTDLAEKTILTFLLENNVAKQNGSDLVIAAKSGAREPEMQGWIVWWSIAMRTFPCDG